MRTGERCLLHVRSDYAYGAQGHFSFPHIPPSMDMVFDVELLGFDELDEEVSAPELRSKLTNAP